MKNFLKYNLLICAILITISCEKKEPEVEYIPTWPMTGEWWATYKNEDGTPVTNYEGYSRIYTFNTSSNTTDSIWVTDGGSFEDFQIKVPINLNSRTFAITNGEDIISGNDASIYNGKVIELPDGDSIYMEVEWNFDEGNYYIISGRRVKGFGYDTGGSYEDDYGK